MPHLLLGMLAVVAIGWTVADGDTAQPKPKSLTWREYVRGLYLEAAACLAVTPPRLIEDVTVDNAASDGDVVRYDHAWLVADVCRVLRGDPRCLRAALIYLWAHELTHHYFADAYDVTAREFDLEQRADYWAGVALARAGATRAEIECVLPIIGGACSDSHGCPADRLSAIWQGYRDEVRRLAA